MLVLLTVGNLVVTYVVLAVMGTPAAERVAAAVAGARASAHDW
jgi:hypothetical protein